MRGLGGNLGRAQKKFTAESLLPEGGRADSESDDDTASSEEEAEEEEEERCLLLGGSAKEDRCSVGFPR